MSRAPALPFVSVVVPVHNGAATLPDVLDGLYAQTYPADRREVIVVDNRSTDGSAEIARARGATVVAEPDVQSAAAARNRGIASAGGEVLAFLDADCIPGAGWLEGGVRALGAEGVDLAGGRVDIRPAAGAPLLAAYDRLTYIRQAERIGAQGLSASANLFVPRRVIEAIGPFRPDLTAAEDDEFCLRARDAGLSIAYVDAAAVSRQGPATVGEVLRRHHRSGRARAVLGAAGIALPRAEGGGAGSGRARYAARVWAEPGLSAGARIALLLLNLLGGLAQWAGQRRGPRSRA